MRALRGLAVDAGVRGCASPIPHLRSEMRAPRVRWPSAADSAAVAFIASGALLPWPPHRSETFKLSRDPLFIDKVATSSGCISTRRTALWCCAATRRIRFRRWTARRRCCPCDRARSTPHARLQVTRHHQPLRRAGCKDRNDHRPNTPPSSLVRVSQIPRRHREERAAELDVPLILDNYGTHKTELIRSWLPSVRASICISRRPRPVGSIWSNDGLPC